MENDQTSGFEGDAPSSLTVESCSKVSHAESCRRWRSKNPEKVKEYSQKWDAANLERRREIRRRARDKWQAANREKHLEMRSRWRVANAEKLRLQHQTYREKKKAVRIKLPAQIAQSVQSSRERFIQSLNMNEVFREANTAVSRSLPEFVRDDVIAEICLAVYAGQLALADIAAKAKAYVTAFYRESGHHKMRSLHRHDAENGTDLIERISFAAYLEECL